MKTYDKVFILIMMGFVMFAVFKGDWDVATFFMAVAIFLKM